MEHFIRVTNKQFPCDICDKKCTTALGLKMHKQAKHQISDEDEEDDSEEEDDEDYRLTSFYFTKDDIFKTRLKINMYFKDETNFQNLKTILSNYHNFKYLLKNFNIIFKFLSIF